MSINNMSYDIVYYSRCCDLDTAGRQRTIVRFFTRAPSCGQEAAVLSRMLQRNCEQL